mgnify:CR=1 FL=1
MFKSIVFRSEVAMSLKDHYGHAVHPYSFKEFLKCIESVLKAGGNEHDAATSWMLHLLEAKDAIKDADEKTVAETLRGVVSAIPLGTLDANEVKQRAFGILVEKEAPESILQGAAEALKPFTRDEAFPVRVQQKAVAT